MSTRNITLENTNFDRFEKIYSHYRAQVVHENDLYNQRIIWLITMQGFLYATIGLIIEGIMPLSDKLNDLHHMNYFILLICVLGISVAAVADRLLTNARVALGQLRQNWEALLATGDFTAEKQYFPHVSGGDGKPFFNPVFRSGNLPKLFIVSWFVCGSILIYPFWSR